MIDIGRVVWRGLAVLFGSFVPFLLISAVTTATPFFYTWTHYGPIRSAATLASIPLHIVFRGLCEALIVYATLDALSGRRVRYGFSVARGLRRAGPVVATSLLSGVIFAIGMFLLVIPGLIAMVKLYVATAPCVVERLGPVQSIKRSAALSEWYGWSIFAVISAVLAVRYAVNWLIDTLVPNAPAWLGPAVAFSWMTFVNAYSAVLVTVIYYDRRVVADGADRLAGALD